MRKKADVINRRMTDFFKSRYVEKEKYDKKVEAGKEYVRATDKIISCDYWTNETGKPCGDCRACLKEKVSRLVEAGNRVAGILKLHAFEDDLSDETDKVIGEWDSVVKGLEGD